jgi:SAM-dependent methyltransferase
MLLKDESYYDYLRWELLEFIHDGNNRILDIGCGEGFTGRAIKDVGKAEEVIGIEIVPEVAEKARDKLDEVICGNIETLDLPYNKYFDYVIAGDVLEHLHDPWNVVKKIKHYIKAGGYIISSVPNVRYLQVLKTLVLKGTWKYEKAGILDFTHLRFFAKKDIIELFEKNRFAVIEIIPSFKIKARRGKYNIINNLTFGFFEEFLAYQYIIKARNS